jgi:hypothetical protein
LDIDTAFFGLKLDKFNEIKDEHPLNILTIVVTFDTSKFEISK